MNHNKSVSLVTETAAAKRGWNACRERLIVMGAVLLTAFAAPAHAGTMVFTGDDAVWGTVEDFCGAYTFTPHVLQLEKMFASGGTAWSIGFSQFGLQRWYDAGIDPSRITAVRFSFEQQISDDQTPGVAYQVEILDIIVPRQGTVADFPEDFFETRRTTATTVGYGHTNAIETRVCVDVTAAFLRAVQARREYSIFCLDITAFAPRRKYDAPRLAVEYISDDTHHDDDNAAIPITIRPREPHHDHTGGVCLTWEDPGTAGGRVYTVYLGEDKSSLSPVYTGTTTECKLETLKCATVYYWQVESADTGGVISRSPLASFATVKKTVKAFNYPNPFNPARGKNTHIVFDMPADGSAEISIFTEMGDLCWQRGFDNLTAGSNQLLYNGTDENGRSLYNGTYLCRIVKKHAGGRDTEHCRLLVVK